MIMNVGEYKYEPLVAWQCQGTDKFPIVQFTSIGIKTIKEIELYQIIFVLAVMSCVCFNRRNQYNTFQVQFADTNLLLIAHSSNISVQFIIPFFLISGNLLVIIVVIMSRRLRSITNFFLANLAVADLCVGVFCVIQTLTFYLIDR